jgi:hypothetical protein
MVDFFDLLNDLPSDGDTRLEEARVGEDPLAFLVFTTEAEPASMHFEKDESVNSYVICPGKACPICWLGSRAKEFILLPIRDVESGQVKVLRVSTRRGPASLLDQLRVHLGAPDSPDRLLVLSRKGNVYHLKVERLGPDADRGAVAIEAFVEARKNGLKLASAFTSLSAEELSELGRIRKLLDARGFGTPGKDVPE